MARCGKCKKTAPYVHAVMREGVRVEMCADCYYDKGGKK